MVALGEIAECPTDLFAKMIIVDVAIANVWMGVLLFLSGKADRIDAWTGANTTALKALRERVAAFQEKTMRIPTLTDLIIILAFGFVCFTFATSSLAASFIRSCPLGAGP